MFNQTVNNSLLNTNLPFPLLLVNNYIYMELQTYSACRNIKYVSFSEL